MDDTARLDWALAEGTLYAWELKEKNGERRFIGTLIETREQLDHAIAVAVPGCNNRRVFVPPVQVA